MFNRCPPDCSPGNIWQKSGGHPAGNLADIGQTSAGYPADNPAENPPNIRQTIQRAIWQTSDDIWRISSGKSTETRQTIWQTSGVHSADIRWTFGEPVVDIWRTYGKLLAANTADIWQTFTIIQPTSS